MDPQGGSDEALNGLGVGRGTSVAVEGRTEVLEGLEGQELGRQVRVQAHHPASRIHQIGEGVVLGQGAPGRVGTFTFVRDTNCVTGKRACAQIALPDGTQGSVV